jgi:hypothetical protein
MYKILGIILKTRNTVLLILKNLQNEKRSNYLSAYVDNGNPGL